MRAPLPEYASTPARRRRRLFFPQASSRARSLALLFSFQVVAFDQLRLPALNFNRRKMIRISVLFLDWSPYSIVTSAFIYEVTTNSQTTLAASVTDSPRHSVDHLQRVAITTSFATTSL